MLSDSLQTLVSMLKDAGYEVVTKPQELMRPNELYVDVAGVDVEEYYTGGAKIVITYIVGWMDTNRVAFLNKCEEILKTINTPIYTVSGVDTDIDGEYILGFLSIKYVEVIEFGE